MTIGAAGWSEEPLYRRQVRRQLHRAFGDVGDVVIAIAAEIGIAGHEVNIPGALEARPVPDIQTDDR